MPHITLKAIVVAGLGSALIAPLSNANSYVGSHALEPPAADTISNEMASYDFVLGKWTCKGSDARGKVTYTFTQDNGKTKDGSWFTFGQNAFLTYDGKARLWRYIEIDGAGGYSMGTTPGWIGNTQSWTGYSYSNGVKRPWGRYVFIKVSDREKRQVFYKQVKNGRFEFDGSDVCVKSDSVTAGSALPPDSAKPQTGGRQDETLRSELLRRVDADQSVRLALMRKQQQGLTPDSLDAERMIAVDTVNTAWLRRIVAGRGWPGKTLVGADGANAAFLLVQHADRDTAFQAAVLPLLQRAYVSGEATGQELALLTDRVATARGLPQVYGSQASIVAGRVILKPISDSAGVDARRARIGLPPLAEYVRMLDSLYTPHRQ